jgi:phosphate-selective porin OprO/OprP
MSTPLRLVRTLMSINALAFVALAAPAIAHAQSASNENEALKAAMAQIAALTERLAALEARVADADQAPVKVVDTNKADADTVKVSLKPGLSVASGDGKTTFAVDGRVMVDAGWVTEDGAADIGDDTDMRHLWLGFSGKFSDDWRYKLQTSIDNNAIGVKDAYIAFDGIRNVPIMVGNFYENNGIEIMSGNLNTTFMEGGTGITAFRTLRHLGVSVDPYGDNWGAQIGLFGDGVADPAVAANDEGWSIAARGHVAPIMSKEMLLHLGGSYRYRTPDSPAESVRFRASGESHVIGETLVDTGNITGVENYTTAALEAMYRWGGLTLMSEYNVNELSRTVGAEPSFDGGYVSLGWLLTGEGREYNAKRGTVGKLKPNSPFAMGGAGMGAWEVAARFNTLDLTDETVAGGEMDSVTLGLNWYPNAFARFMLNYVRNDIDNTGPVAFRDTDPEYVMVRAQADF